MAARPGPPANGLIDGGVIYFGHSGPFIDPQINDRVTILAVGEAGGNDDYNISFRTAPQLSKVLTAYTDPITMKPTNIIGGHASILLNGCEAGATLDDAYALYRTSIAQLVSNATQRGVYAYDKAMYFSINDAAHATTRVPSQEPNPLPATPPLYMIPEGPPGNKPAPLPFCPNGKCEN